MRISKLLLCIGVFAASLTACQKETSQETLNAQPGNPNGGNNNPGGGGGGGGTSNGSELATWNFVNARVTLNNVAQGSVSGITSRMNIDLDVTSGKNAGTVKFDGTAMTLNQVTFAFDGNIKMAGSTAGINIPVQNMPFQQNFPASSDAYNYKKIGTDSLYFDDFFLRGVDIAGTIITGPAGAKLKWDGNKLIMTIATASKTTENIPGMGNMDMSEKTAVIITLQKP